MKKIISFMLLILLIFALVGCSVQNTSKLEDKNEEKSEEKREEVTEKQIGRIITHEDFLTEFSKRVNLQDYDLDFTDHGHILNYVYSSKTDCEIKQNTSNFQVEIDGITVSLPLTVNEFVNLGFELISMDDNIDAPANLSIAKRSALFGVKTPSGNTFSIYTISKDYTHVPLKDLIVIQISCNFYKDDTIDYSKGKRCDAPEINFFQDINGKSTVDSIIKELKTPQVINFTQSLYNGKTTLADLQLTFNFSNQKYNGNVCITAHTVLDEKIKQTSYASFISYIIDYESIKNN